MKKGKDAPPDSALLRAQLRARAEASVPAGPTPSLGDDARLIHELQVHQIELEMQNQELLASRAESEEALARYAELYDFAPFGYFTVGRDGYVRRANFAGASLVGEDRAALVGQGLRRWFIDSTEVDRMLGRAFGGEARVLAELELCARGGAADPRRHAHLTLSVRGDECLAVVVDVTARRRAEEELREAQRAESIGRLAGGVAHDFNNMLTIILTHAQDALEQAPPGSDLAESLAAITAAADRSASLTRQLLAFGRRLVLRPEPLLLDGVLGQIAGLIERVLGAHIKLVVSASPDLWHVEVDRAQLEQVVVNLVLNARDAMPEGGTVAIALDNQTLGERPSGARAALAPGEYARLTVGDTGAGMDEATRLRVFEPFFTTKARGDGTGLGLSAAQGFARQCGGDLTLESAPGKGTTFELFLPRARGASRASPEPSPSLGSRPANKATETILLVEDEPAVRRIAKRLLVEAGYAVLEASDGEKGLAVARAHTGELHLALLDVIMPGMNGPALARRLLEDRPGLAVVFMSGYPDDAVRPDLRDMAARVVAKPFARAVLLAALREALVAR